MLHSFRHTSCDLFHSSESPFSRNSLQQSKYHPAKPPTLQSPDAQLQLLNSGQQSYREFLTLLRWRVNERTTIFASYTRSRARGELNDYNQFFGNSPIPSSAPTSTARSPPTPQPRPLLERHRPAPPARLHPYPRRPHRLPLLPPRSELELPRPRKPGRTIPHLPRPRHQAPVPGRLHPSAATASSSAPASPSTTFSTTTTRGTSSSSTPPQTTAPSTNSIGRLWRLDRDFDF
jgi:hypothetical protein